MVDVYRIRNWSTNFENAKSRKLGRCRYVCMPNKQDGLGLGRILAEPDGATIFGVWCLILQACSRQTERAGWLTDDGTEKGRPWDLDDLAFRWRRPIGEVRRCVSVVVAPKVGWMEVLQSKWAADPTRRSSGALEGMEGMEGMEGTPSGGSQQPQPDRDDPLTPGPGEPKPPVGFGLGTWVKWHSIDPARVRENLAELAGLVTRFGRDRVHAAAEAFAAREHDKAWPNQLLKEIMGPKPTAGAVPEVPFTDEDRELERRIAAGEEP